MNKRDFSAIVSIAIITTIVLGYKFNEEYLSDYRGHQFNAYHRTVPVSGSYGSNSTSYSFLSSSSKETYPHSENVDEMLKNKPPIPSAYRNMIDVTDYLDETKKLEVIPYYWHIHRSAGGTFEQLMGECLGLNLASSSLPLLEFDTDEVQLMRSGDVKYVNVNLLTREGIERAARMEISHHKKERVWNQADAIISPYVYDIASVLFKKKDRYSSVTKGAMFTLIRSPIEREISLFYILRGMNHTAGEDVSSFEITDWIKTPGYTGNMMVRQLTNKLDNVKELTMDDLMVAKEVLRRKFIVGLLGQKVESWNRFKKLFGDSWELYGLENSDCEEKKLNWGWKNQNHIRPMIDFSVMNSMQKDDPSIIDLETFNEIAKPNQLDMMLFEYAQYLFWEQRVLF